MNDIRSGHNHVSHTKDHISYRRYHPNPHWPQMRQAIVMCSKLQFKFMFEIVLVDSTRDQQSYYAAWCPILTTRHSTSKFVPWQQFLRDCVLDWTPLIHPINTHQWVKWTNMLRWLSLSTLCCLKMWLTQHHTACTRQWRTHRHRHNTTQHVPDSDRHIVIVTTPHSTYQTVTDTSSSSQHHTSHTLSLIHIWRCRRSTLCRSRWSPYH